MLAFSIDKKVKGENCGAHTRRCMCPTILCLTSQLSIEAAKEANKQFPDTMIVFGDTSTREKQPCCHHSSPSPELNDANTEHG